MKSTVFYRVNFFDTDAMSVVHHANYIRWFEIGRSDFLRQNDISLLDLMADGYSFPIFEVAAKYHVSGKYDDILRIETTPQALTRVKMVFTYEIFREKDNILLVTGSSTNVFTKAATGKITRLDDGYYKKLIAGLK